MALGWGVQPSEWKALTILERIAFKEEAERINEAAKKKR